MSSRKPAVGFIFVTVLLDVLGLGLIIPILPKLVEALQGGNVAAASHTVGFLAALAALMQFLFAPVLGSLSDQFGRRPIILGSLLGSALDYLLLAFAPSLGWFYVGRFIWGIMGASITTATAYIADISPPEKRAANFGLIGAAFGLGFILGPAMGGWLGSINLRLPFLVAAGLTATNWLYGFFVLPESHAKENRRPFSWKRANPIGSFHGLRRYPVVFGLAMALFLTSLAQFMLQSVWALYTSYRYGWNPKQIGLSLTAVGVLAIIVQAGLSRRIIPFLGEKKSILCGFVFSATAHLSYGLAPRGWMIYPALVLGCLAGIAQPAGQSIVAKTVGPTEQGAIQGALTSLSSLGGIIGPLIATNLFGWFIRPKTPIHLPGISFFAGSALVLSALLLTIRTFRRAGPPPLDL